MFTTGGAAAALSATSFRTERACGAQEPTVPVPSSPVALEVRPYQLMCVICQIGRGCTENLDDPRLNEIVKAVRQDRKRPLTLRCNTDHVYRYQNPGHGEDTSEGELFNAKRDLDILQKLGLVPGDTRPAVDLIERVLAKVIVSRDICGYEKVTSETWRGCAQANSGNYEKGRALGIKAIFPPRNVDEKARYKKSSAADVYEARILKIRPHHLLCMSCFYGRSGKLAPIKEDNLFEAIDVIQKNPDIPVMLVAGCCMICPPCEKYDPATNFCVGGKSMALRDQKKDLDVLQKVGLKYGDTLSARQLYQLVYERIHSTRDICGFGDNLASAYEWSICGGAEKDGPYQKARTERLGIKG